MWSIEVKNIEKNLIKDTQEFLKIKSVLDEESKDDNAPFGIGIKNALEFALNKCDEFGMNTKNLDGYAGHAEIGEGDEIVGILCHVDVVPEGDGWSYEPYSAKINNGKIYARGAIDDKGPTMAAIYALKIIKDLDLKLNKRVRIIFGTDEETSWRGINHYFKKEEMPTYGFAPDADFPIIITEKGIANVSFNGEITPVSDKDKARIKYFNSGRRVNMVPDEALANIKGAKDVLNEIKPKFEEYLNDNSREGSISYEEDELILKLKGVSAHGMEPFKGVNAGLELLNFLLSIEDLLNADDWVKWTNQYLYNDFYGINLGISYEDEESGELTVNPGIMSYKDNKLNIKLNIRYPITTSFDEMISKLTDKANLINFNIEYDNAPPHHVDKNHILVKTLKKVYEEQTGQEATLLAIGGGTYARALETGVAFGPLFPGKVETAHQKDEHIDMDDLIKATAIYAQAIYELAK